jgi:hypothetical protein
VTSFRTKLLRRLRGVRVEPRQPAPAAVGADEWAQLAAQIAARGPGVIGATGGSGTRVVARAVRSAGMFIGTDLNRSEDALDFAGFSDRWVDTVARGERPPELVGELRALVARQWRSRPDGSRAWGWKEPRSLYLVDVLEDELPGLRFLHVVRDGRDMAFSENQVQLRKHGDAVLGRGEGEAEAVRSIRLWCEVNLRAADVGERLGGRYLRIRFEDLCAEPEPVLARIFDFFGLEGDVERIAAEEVSAPPTLGRWRSQDPATLRALQSEAGEALSGLGYQSSSE